MYTGGHPCRPDHTRHVTVSGRSRNTCTQAVIPAGQTTLSRSLCQGGAATHVHRRSSLLTRPHLACDCVREEPQNTYADGHPACQTTFSRSLCKGGAVICIHRWSSLPARLHSAGHCVREEPQHTYTGSHPCKPDRTGPVTMSGSRHNTDTHVAYPVGQITPIKILQAHLS